MENNFLTETGLEFAQAFLLSLGVGLLMGLERERHSSSRAGLRTFALTALLGHQGKSGSLEEFTRK